MRKRKKRPRQGISAFPGRVAYSMSLAKSALLNANKGSSLIQKAREMESCLPKVAQSGSQHVTSGDKVRMEEGLNPCCPLKHDMMPMFLVCFPLTM